MPRPPRNLLALWLAALLALGVGWTATAEAGGRAARSAKSPVTRRTARRVRPRRSVGARAPRPTRRATRATRRGRTLSGILGRRRARADKTSPPHKAAISTRARALERPAARGDRVGKTRLRRGARRKDTRQRARDARRTQRPARARRTQRPARERRTQRPARELRAKRLKSSSQRPGRRGPSRDRHVRRSRARATHYAVTHGATLGLLVQGAPKLFKFLRISAPAMQALGVVAPIAMTVAATVGLVRAKNNTERVDATHGLLWAAQGGALATQTLAGINTIATQTFTGVAGGALQLGAGIYRVGLGIKNRSWSKVTSGLIDMTAGTAWALSSVTFGPKLAMGVFVGATLFKMVFESRGDIAHGFQRLKQRLR